MQEFQVGFRSRADRRRANAMVYTSRLIVTDDAVQLVQWKSLPAPLVPYLIVLWLVSLLFVIPLLMIPSPQHIWIILCLKYFVHAMVLIAFLPIRRCCTFSRQHITRCIAFGREVLLQTADDQLVVTAQTTREAQAIVSMIQEGTSDTFTAMRGREMLQNASGFYYAHPATVTVDHGELLVDGYMIEKFKVIMAITLWAFSPLIMISMLPKPLPLWGGFLMLGVFFSGITVIVRFAHHGKPLKRTHPLSDLREITAIHQYVTFLAPHASMLAEWRYTWKMASPEEAERLARCLRGEDDEPFTTNAAFRSLDHSSSPTEGRQYQRLMPYLAEGPIQPGRVVLDDDRVTLIGRSGLYSPLTGRLAAAITLPASFTLMPLVNWAFTPFQGEISTLVIWLTAACVALALVYIPASAIFAHCLSSRISLPRTKTGAIDRLGREVSWWVGSEQHVTLAFPTDEDAKAFVRAVERNTEM